ncbi:condensation domain-containing protein [Streptoalloteichus hindustanus]|uniref:Non-ribosomal peptide synthetase component F n=1 Tax=Streptoalloteichus hindustanus TaxID=2017 RepID=A0A1M5CH66_STRHI|nr:condensation domain-containing protein [Streptoalloteichus hindustanus]SHF54105.1 Non-ribosomal peptide synthetase component F [Streptoalloteichus hindustanus]
MRRAAVTHHTSLGPVARWWRRLWSRVRGEGTAREERPVPLALPRDRPLPLSLTQESEWVFAREAAGEDWHQPTLPRLVGSLHPVALSLAVRAVVDRHESMRTRFPVVDGEAVQVVDPPGALTAPLVDLSGLDPEARSAAVGRIEEEAATHHFDMAGASLVRVALLRLDPAEHGLLLCVPHLVADLWSMAVLTSDLRASYQAIAQGRPVELPPVAQPADVGARERAHWTAERAERELRRWRERLDGRTALALPTDHPRPTGRHLTCFCVGDSLDVELSERVRQLGREQGATLYVTMLAAFHALLARYCSAERPVTYSSSAGRRSRLVENVVGAFSDYLIVVGDCSGDPTFEDLLARTRIEYFRAHDHQRLPFPLLVQGVDPERALRPNLLEQVGFSVHNTPPAVLELGSDVAVENFGTEPPEDEECAWTADLVFEVYDYGAGEIQVDLTLNKELFEPVAGEQWFERYRKVLDQVTADPGLRLSSLDILLPEDETPDVEEESTSSPAGTVVEALRERLTLTPDAIAVRHEERFLTFAGLARQAGALASRLSDMSPEVGRPVLVALADPLDQVVATTAVLLAGHVPIGSSSPQWTDERFRDVVEVLGSPLAIGRGEVTAKWGVPDADTLDLDRLGSAPRRQVVPPAHPELLAALRPATEKARLVMTPHRALLADAAAFADTAGLGVGIRVAATEDRAADVALALVSGATVVVPSGQPDPAQIDVAVATADQWRRLLATGIRASGTEAWCGPAPVPARLVAGLADAGFLVRGRHGWPEVGTTLTSARLDEPAALERGVGTLGQVVSGRRVSLVDSRGNPCAVGVPGELTAPAVASGYLGEPGATADRFVPDPTGTGGRRHRGDVRVLRTNQGTLELAAPVPGHVAFGGRLLDVELIEQTLAECDGVTEALATVQDWPNSFGLPTPTLVAWLTGSRKPTEGEVWEHARHRLPPHHLPTVLAWLPPDDLARARVAPGTLPSPTEALRLPIGTEPPRTETERALAPLWASVLGGKETPRRDEHFFRAGGRVIDAVRLVDAIEREWGIDVSVSAFLAAPRLAELAELIEHSAGGRPPRTVHTVLTEAEASP